MWGLADQIAADWSTQEANDAHRFDVERYALELGSKATSTNTLHSRY